MDLSTTFKRGMMAWAIFVSILLFLIVALPTCRPAHGQQQPRAARLQPGLTPALFLARVAINEGGWTTVETGDIYLIHECFLRGAEHQEISYLSYATHYSQRVAGLRPSTSGRIAWTMNLRPDGREPAGWPQVVSEPAGTGPARVRQHPPFSRYRDAWLSTYAAAQEAIATLTLDDVDEWGVCDGPVHDWGSPALDHARAVRLGLLPVSCGIGGGSTANEGWARPSRLPTTNVPELVIEVD